MPPRLGEIADGEAAQAAGLRTGDLVIAADGQPVSDWGDWVELHPGAAEQTVQLQVQRDGDGLGATARHRRGRTGWQAHRTHRRRPADAGGLWRRAAHRAALRPIEAIGIAFDKTVDMSAVTLRMFWKMLWGEVSVRNISGPISIAEFAGYSLNDGFVSFLGFLAIISISLGLINLLPIPLLDGGQLMYGIIEAVKGAPLSQRAELIGQQVGVALLLALMSLAFYNDISSRLVN